MKEHSSKRKKKVVIIDAIPNLPNEEWRPISGYDGKYLVSNMGRVKSLKRGSARLLTAFVNNKGYYRVCLCNAGQGKHFLVSRLVAAAFCPNDDPESNATVDHIDGDKSNNRAENLRFLSQEENCRAYFEKRRKGAKRDDDV